MTFQDKSIPPVIATEVGVKLTSKGLTVLEFYFEGTLINCIAIDKEKTIELEGILRKIALYKEKQVEEEAKAKSEGAKLPSIVNQPLKIKEKK